MDTRRISKKSWSYPQPRYSLNEAPGVRRPAFFELVFISGRWEIGFAAELELLRLLSVVTHLHVVTDLFILRDSFFDFFVDHGAS